MPQDAVSEASPRLVPGPVFKDFPVSQLTTSNPTPHKVDVGCTPTLNGVDEADEPTEPDVSSTDFDDGPPTVKEARPDLPAWKHLYEKYEHEREAS